MKSDRIRRTIIMEWNPEVPRDKIVEISLETRENLEKIEGVYDIRMGTIKKCLIGEGRDFSRFGAWHYGYSLDFENEAAYQRYNADPGHAEIHRKYEDLILREIVMDILDED